MRRVIDLVGKKGRRMSFGAIASKGSRGFHDSRNSRGRSLVQTTQNVYGSEILNARVNHRDM